MLWSRTALITCHCHSHVSLLFSQRYTHNRGLSLSLSKMGCFLQCFGLSKKRKRRKTPYKVLAAADQKHGNYEALDSTLTVNLAIKENPIVPFSNFRDECKEQTSVKNKKKKVSFNLNVQIYEPNPNAYQILDSDENEEENDKNNSDESATSKINYPSNHRYYNYKDGHDEEEDLGYEDDDGDYEFDDDDEWDDEIEIDDQNTRQKNICEKFCSSMAEDQNRIPLELKPTGSSLSGQDRSQNMHSVLQPVENLTQWKAIKAKAAATSKNRRAENVPLEQNTSMPLLSEPYFNLSPFSLESVQSKPLLPEIAVDASLSNWLISPNSNGSATAIHCQ